MSKQSITLIGEAVQPVPRNHGHPTDAHCVSWLEGVRRDLAAVRVKRGLPQARSDHATLAEREVRYAGYLKDAGWSQ